MFTNKLQIKKEKMCLNETHDHLKAKERIEFF